MPDLNLGTQVFDLTFSPTHDVVFTGLLTGHVKAFSYDDEGKCEPKFSVRPAKKTARTLAVNPDGTELYCGSKDRSIHTIDVGTGKVSHECLQAHESSINRITRFMSMLATGDDDGIIKLWDPRQISSIRSYTHHKDLISDFLWLEDKKHLVATSGDGTLSVLDVRSNKTAPFAQSEDQEDELLSVVGIKGYGSISSSAYLPMLTVHRGSKLAVGTQTGIISLWNRSSGYGDCVDRVPGHPHSVDALATLTDDVIVTGSSDGLVRVVQLLPHKLLGVIADHGEFPIERLQTDRNGAWLGSASHDDILKLTDVRDALVDSDEEGSDGDEGDSDSGDDGIKVGGGVDEDSSEDEPESEAENIQAETMDTKDMESDPDSEPEPRVEAAREAESSDESEPEELDKRSKKRKKKQGSGMGESNAKRGKVDGAFFAEL
ncbi:WD repeat-containing protein [Ceratobasidium sp. AG-Ba]|nr:WD repeat-containing protein [Ceratobasidium sp. AG-Ba]